MNRTVYAISCALALLTSGCVNSREPERHAMVIHLKPDKLEYYKQLHRAPWPGVLAQLERSHVHNFSIHLVEMRAGEFTLFGYFEYTGLDFDADMAAMAKDPETQRWWQETGPCQQAVPMAKGKLGDTDWYMMQEIFHAR